MGALSAFAILAAMSMPPMRHARAQSMLPPADDGQAFPTTDARPLTPEAEDAIRRDIETVRPLLPDRARKSSDFDEAAILWIDGHIDRMRLQPSEDSDRLIDALGAYLGETIRLRHGGRWVETDMGVGIEVMPDLIVFPFDLVRKHFAYGVDYSILPRYRMIPLAKLQRTLRTK